MSRGARGGQAGAVRVRRVPNAPAPAGQRGDALAGAGLAVAGLAAAGAAAALAVARVRAARRVEAQLAARLPVGADGLMAGAGSIALGRPGGGRPAALVLHGFGDTAQSVGELAAHLHAAGWAVRAPLLPGHGRTAQAFAAVRAAEWLHAARDAYRALRAESGAPVALVGQSMGAALAAVLAAEAAAEGEPVPGLVLLAPYLATGPVVRWAGRMAPLLALGVTYLSSDGGARSIHDAEARARTLGYRIVTPHLLRELARVVDLARRALPRIEAPTLGVLSRQDHRVLPADGAAAFARVGAGARRPPVKQLEWLEGSGHVISVDRERARVFALTEGWLRRWAPAAGAARPRAVGAWRRHGGAVGGA